MKVLFVCLGNICRSPAGEGIFKTILQKEGLSSKVQCDSAGTNGYHVGELPDPRMREHGKNRGYEFSSRARQFTAQDFSDFDLILTMDHTNYQNVTNLADIQEDVDKVKRFCDYVHKIKVDEVPDPYYGGADGFDQVIDILEEGCQNLIQDLKSKPL